MEDEKKKIEAAFRLSDDHAQAMDEEARKFRYGDGLVLEVVYTSSPGSACMIRKTAWMGDFESAQVRAGELLYDRRVNVVRILSVSEWKTEAVVAR